MGKRIALIGMNNPLSENPRRALWPDPPNCTGWRIWKMLEARTGATQTDYLRAFHRYNLGTERRWHSENAAIHWREIERDVTEQFDRIVFLGCAVRRAAGIDLPNFFVSDHICCVPHPSGLNRWYNSDLNRQLVEILLEELYTEALP